MRGAGIGPRVGERPEAGTVLGDLLENVEQVAGRARQAVEAGHYQHVAGDQAADRALEAGAVASGSAGLLLDDRRAAGRRQRLDLRGERLVVGRYPGVANLHAPVLHKKPAQEKRLSVSDLRFVHNHGILHRQYRQQDQIGPSLDFAQICARLGMGIARPWPLRLGTQPDNCRRQPSPKAGPQQE